MAYLRTILTEEDKQLSLIETQEAEARQPQLERIGFKALYGGGSFNKGHGFWIQYNEATFICNHPERFGNLNECFWTMDALNFAIEAAREAFYGNNDELFEYLCELAGYEMNGTHYPSNGLELSECIRLVMELPGYESTFQP